jgi:hypothetical protein
VHRREALGGLGRCARRPANRVGIAAASGLLGLLGCAGCGDRAVSTTRASILGTRTVSQGDYRGDWPFGPDRGVLRCRRAGSDRIVTFAAGGIAYGLNGAARRRGFRSVRAILLTDHAGLPFDYSPVLRDGLALCSG